MTVFGVTGGSGFIGKNLSVRLAEAGHTVVTVPNGADVASIIKLIANVDFVFHLAGVNRPPSPEEFISGNVGMTEKVIAAVTGLGRAMPILFASSIQAEQDNAYGQSKRVAETLLESYSANTASPVYICRLPNVFGKWCRPNYNSAVATFCYNISHGLPITINDPHAVLRLVYIDDVVDTFLAIGQRGTASGRIEVHPVYETTVGEVAAHLRNFRESRQSLNVGAVGAGLVRALYATYVSYLEPNDFVYSLTAHTDQRGMFAEMLRTSDSGQFSFFTAHPGITRGGHYHHTKTEKFLVVQGKALFGFRNIRSEETFEIKTSGDEPQVVETIPGWAHDITNIGSETMIVMLWANELFDKDRPDTVAARVLS